MAANNHRLFQFVIATFMGAAGSNLSTDAVAQTPQSTAVAETVLENPTNMNPESAKIWNSPNMLRARAWLYDRISKSAKITPAEGEHYIKVLENMTPDEMKLWLMKFDEEEEQRQQQNAFWQQSQQALAGRAMAVHRATQQAYANLNQEETASAQQEQGQLNEQAAMRQDRAFENQFPPYGPYPYSPYGYGFNPNYGFHPGYGGTHYHYHIYPYR
jgi:hypothetical protein